MSGFILIALAALGGQDAPRAPAPTPSAEYAAPVVRPFEPSAGLATPSAEGAEGAAAVRRPLSEPVLVDVYAGDYELTPTDAELAYEQGVSAAEISMDGRMGGLDGRWRVVDPHGALLIDLLLTDNGGAEPLEGAWSAGRRSGVAASGYREPGAPVLLVLDGDCVLRLTVTAGGVEAVLIRDGREHPVRLTRPYPVSSARAAASASAS